eukprot:2939323-Pleurochrysis_carterae.AAC.1
MTSHALITGFGNNMSFRNGNIVSHCRVIHSTYWWHLPTALSTDSQAVAKNSGIALLRELTRILHLTHDLAEHRLPLRSELTSLNTSATWTTNPGPTNPGPDHR